MLISGCLRVQLNARILEILEVLLKGSRSAAGHRLLLPAGDCDTSLSSQELYRIKLSQTTENRYFDAVPLITDPPYYDAVPYAYLSDFFYVWLKRSLAEIMPDLFSEQSVPKNEEIVVDRPHELSDSEKDISFYQRALTEAFADSRRVLRPDGIGTIVFASKTTASWEAIVQAVVDSGWVITGSWPIDTEMEARVAAQGQARLGSSVHLVCRPRENPDGSVRKGEIGDWRDVLTELPEADSSVDASSNRRRDRGCGCYLCLPWSCLRDLHKIFLCREVKW